MNNKFVNTVYQPLPENEFVVGYHPDWVHEDFNPDGIRFGYMTSEKTFMCSVYNHEFENFEAFKGVEGELPVMWMKPSPPIFKITDAESENKEQL